MGRNTTDIAVTLMIYNAKNKHKTPILVIKYLIELQTEMPPTFSLI